MYFKSARNSLTSGASIQPTEIRARIRGLEGESRHAAAEQALLGLLSILGLDEADPEGSSDDDEEPAAAEQ